MSYLSGKGFKKIITLFILVFVIVLTAILGGYSFLYRRNSFKTKDKFVVICEENLLDKNKFNVTNVEDGCQKDFFTLEVKENQRIIDNRNIESVDRFLPRDVGYFQKEFDVNKDCIQISYDDLYKNDSNIGELLILHRKEKCQKI